MTDDLFSIAASPRNDRIDPVRRSIDIAFDDIGTRSPREGELTEIFGRGILPERHAAARTCRLPIVLNERWTIGAIVGPSGSGKSSAARAVFDRVIDPTDLKGRAGGGALIDEFPGYMRTANIAEILTTVGLASVPCWLRPIENLSTGERARAQVALALAHDASDRPLVIDEFTSTVDREVARSLSCALGKYLRRASRSFVAISCHEDIIDWLDPDWVYWPADDRIERRCLRRRPSLSLTIFPVSHGAWHRFQRHHYLADNLHAAARCFCADLDGRTVAFSAWMWQPHPIRSGWREHRTVTLPQWQGLGIGSALADFVAGCLAATDKPVRSTSSHPAVYHHRNRPSGPWRLMRRGHISKHGNTNGRVGMTSTSSHERWTASFEWRGPRHFDFARRVGLI